MSSTKTTRWIAILSAGAVISGCGASQFGPGPYGTGPQIGVASRQATHGRSWMDGGIGKETLLYISEGNREVDVYRYWQRTLVGALRDFQDPTGECVDKAGDVYIADATAGRVLEYAHGAARPLRTLREGGNPLACAIDLTNGDLAVANGHKGVYVYERGVGRAHIYTDPTLDGYDALAYDNKGDLLVTDSCTSYSNCNGSGFAYLRKGTAHLANLFLPGSSYGLFYGGAIGIQWDGKNFVLDLHELYRFVIRGSEGIVTSETLLTPTLSNPAWIYDANPRLRGTQVVAVTSNGDVDYWHYPQGGSPIAEITGLDKPYAVAVSLKTGL